MNKSETSETDLLEDEQILDLAKGVLKEEAFAITEQVKYFGSEFL